MTGVAYSATARRAILATVDRVRAEQRAEATSDDLMARTQFELLARAALSHEEVFAYNVGVSNTLAELGLTG